MILWLAIGIVVASGCLAWMVYRTHVCEKFILAELRRIGPGLAVSGLDLIYRSNGLLKRGTVYVYLGRLEEEGLVVSAQLDGSGRRVYSIAKDET